MNAVRLADIQSDAMPRTFNILRRIEVFVGYQSEDHKRGLVSDYPEAWAVITAATYGAVTVEGITMWGWDIVEELFERLHDMYDHFASFRLVIENAG